MLGKLSRSVATLWLLFLLAPSAFPAIVYTVTALTQLPSSAEVDGLNNNNQIAGAYDNAAFEGSALTFTPEGIPSGLNSVGYAVINDNGLLGGWGFTSSTEEAFIGSSVVPLAGNLSSFANALNDSGQLAGYVKNSSDATEAAFMTASGTSVQPSGYDLDAINGAGVATGDNSSGQAIYGTASGVTVIPPAAAFDGSYGLGINSAGDVCGYGFLPGGLQGFYFNGTTSVLIPLPQGSTSAEFSDGCISAASQVVGYGYGGATDVGFIWSPTTGTQILNNLVPSNWTITQALYINNSGTILAQGTNGTYTGYVLLTPTPEPSAFWLTGLVLLLAVVIYSRRNRRSHVR